MSEKLENEGSVSVLFSALGAWLGLGAGLALFGLALLAVVSAVYQEDSSRVPLNALERRLTADFASAKPTTVKISDDGTTLKFKRTHSNSGKLVEVIYSCKNEILKRSSLEAENPEVLGSCPGFKFSRDGNRVFASFLVGNTRQRTGWALHRWGILEEQQK